MTCRLGARGDAVLLLVITVVGGGCGGARSGCAEPAPQSPIVATTAAAGPVTTVGGSAPPGSTQPGPAGGWARRFGGPGNDWAEQLSTGPGGQILLTGLFEQTASFGGAPLTSPSGMSSFAASYAASGEHRWSQRTAASRLLSFSATGEPSMLVVGDDAPPATIVSYTPTGAAGATSPLPAVSGWVQQVVRGGDGGLYLAGTFSQRIRVQRTSLTAVGGDDVVVASLSADGEPRWVRRIGSAGDDTVGGLAVDAAGNVTVAGSFADTLTLGRHSAQSAGLTDVFVTSLSPGGEARWLVRMGEDQHDAPSDLVLDANGDVYVTGQLRRAGFYHGGRPTAYDDILLASVSSAGEVRWLHRYQTRTGSGEDLALNERQGLCLVGAFAAEVDFGSVSLSVPEDPAIVNIPGGGEPRTDAFAACFTTAGENRWARRFGGVQSDSAGALGMTEDGTMIVAGSFEGVADFDGRSLQSEGQADVFVLALPPSRQTSAPGD